jgi:hypothetical protein
MTSDVRYEIKNFVTCYLNWNFDSWKIRVGPSQRTRTQTDPGSRLVDPVDDEDVEELRVLRLRVGLQRMTMRSK